MQLFLLSVALAASLTTASPLTTRTTCTAPSNADLTAAKNAIYSAKLVPDLISSFSPSLLIHVTYSDKAVAQGNTFAVAQTLKEPTITITKEANYDPATTKYTVLILDPDVPSPNLPLDRMLLGNFVHLIVSDVQPDCVVALNTTADKRISPLGITTQKRTPLLNYRSLAPLSAALHRYTFLVYRQPADFKPNLIQAQNFLGQPLSVFVASSGLQGPVGANFLREGLLSAGK